MKILLLSILFALGAAQMIPEDKSKNGVDQKPGMCFEDYMRSNPGELQKFMNTMSNYTCSHGGPQPGQQQQEKDWRQPKNQNGSQPHENKMHEMDHSSLRSCSVDRECSGVEKCCRTMCGMRCTRPFEHPRKEEHWDHVPAKSNDKRQTFSVFLVIEESSNGHGVEQRPRQKRHVSEGSGDSSVEQAGGEPEEVQGKGREKRSAKEKGNCKGKGKKEQGASKSADN